MFQIVGHICCDIGGQAIPFDREFHKNTYGSWYRFPVALTGDDRLNRIRALAYLALANGNPVKLKSLWDSPYSCTNLHEIVVLSNVTDPNL